MLISLSTANQETQYVDIIYSYRWSHYGASDQWKYRWASKQSEQKYTQQRVFSNENSQYFVEETISKTQHFRKCIQPWMKDGKKCCNIKITFLHITQTTAKHQRHRITLHRTIMGLCSVITTQLIMKKRSERRKHCALAVVRWSQKFLPCCRPPSRGCGTAKI